MPESSSDGFRKTHTHLCVRLLSPRAVIREERDYGGPIYDCAWRRPRNGFCNNRGGKRFVGNACEIDLRILCIYVMAGIDIGARMKL